MTRLYLVRHAQTAWNQENRIQGGSDVPLSPFGRQQAERLAAFFASCEVRGVFTSPLQRSQQTAQAIAAGPVSSGGVPGAGNGHGLTPIIEAELAEMHLGAWEGLTPAEVDARFEGAYQRWRDRPSTVCIPEAEPLGTFRGRVRRAFHNVLARAGEGEAVVVSHGGVIAALLADCLQADYDALLRRLRLDNAGITALECGNGGPPHVLWVNATVHLDALPQAVGEAWF
jgi:broad specificity phosphatase PhoE